MNLKEEMQSKWQNCSKRPGGEENGGYKNKIGWNLKIDIEKRWQNRYWYVNFKEEILYKSQNCIKRPGGGWMG